MTVPVFEPPPQPEVRDAPDNPGFVLVSRQDFERLVEWLERFSRHVSDNAA